VNFAQHGGMDTPDSRRGRAPEIRLDEDTIAFHLKIDLPRGVKGQLLLRCERNGEIYASIVSAVQRERR
jgi:hypothetical protein